MGQYFYVVNLDKREFLHPHKFGEGLKLMEFGSSSGGTLTALALLLADGNGRGGGDCRSSCPLIGSWAGDRIVVAGDYADAGKFGFEEYRGNVHTIAGDGFRDISGAIASAIAEDEAR